MKNERDGRGRELRERETGVKGVVSAAGGKHVLSAPHASDYWSRCGRPWPVRLLSLSLRGRVAGSLVGSP